MRERLAFAASLRFAGLWIALLASLLIAVGYGLGVAHGANLTIVMPDGCTPVLTGTTVSCQAVAPIPPVPPVTGCTGFATTHNLTMNWGAPTTLTTAMGPDDVVVVQMTTGQTVNPNAYGNITGAEYQSQPSQRVFALSITPCDFGSGLGAGAAGTSNTATVNFSLGTNSSGYYPALLPNATYYFNIKNATNSTCAATGNCGMFFQLHKPPNT